MKYKRKKLNLSVQKDFQIWLLVRILGTVILSVTISGIVLYLYAQQEIEGTYYDVHLTLDKVSDLLLPVILSGAAISFISGLILALFLPQKIAGPLYRIEKDLEQIREGDLDKRIKLRTNDPLKGLANQINSTIDVLVKQKQGNSS